MNNPMPQVFNTPILWSQVCANTILKNHGLEWCLLLGGMGLVMVIISKPELYYR